MLTKIKQLQNIVSQYQKAGQKWPASSADIAKWAVKSGFYNLTGPTLERHCARELAQAMREEYFTDDFGRRVRAKHPAKVNKDGRQITLWADMRTAPRRHMQMAFQLRRRRIVAECKQVKTDVDSYNDYHPEEPPIQMVLNFTRDVEELELSEVAETNHSSPSKFSPQFERSQV